MSQPNDQRQSPRAAKAKSHYGYGQRETVRPRLDARLDIVERLQDMAFDDIDDALAKARLSNDKKEFRTYITASPGWTTRRNPKHDPSQNQNPNQEGHAMFMPYLNKTTKHQPRLKATAQEIARAQLRMTIAPEPDAPALSANDRLLIALHEDDAEMGWLPTSGPARVLTP